MKWVKDRTGRFAKRPHYLPEELDVECEYTITSFLTDKYGRITFPISTEDLTILLEQKVSSLDLYVAGSVLGDDVEGVTDFYSKKKPSVQINERLSSDSRFENRLRTTLTHELGHVMLHSFMYDDLVRGPSLFETIDAPESHQCKRANMLTTNESDWMEWQAGFACGAYLMPITALATSIQNLSGRQNIVSPRPSIQSKRGQDLVDLIATEYSVSKDAARVRLLQRNFFMEGAEVRPLFSPD